MRTLLTNLIPPQCPAQSAAAKPAQASAKLTRTFSQTPVFSSEEDLLEVEVDGTANAAPSVSPAREAGAPLARGTVVYGPNGQLVS